MLPPGVLEIMQALWSRALFEAHRVRADSPSAANALEGLKAGLVAGRELAAGCGEAGGPVATNRPAGFGAALTSLRDFGKAPEGNGKG
jgi:hypothetical protein